ncbi:MAG: DNA polymerase I [Planctomycetota bacterium]
MKSEISKGCDGVKTLYLIDGHYQIYRAFYGLPQQLTSPSGEPTGATHVFCAMLFNLLRERKPDYVAVVMDVSDETVFRREIDENYKAHRDAMPEALEVQADRIVSIVEALGVPIHRLGGFEADDLMATIVERLHDQDVMIYLVSRDKDLDQLLSDRVRLLDPTKDEVIDPAKLLENKGFTPVQAVEVQTLVGDSTDNIPGVPGVGPKTAAKLIAQYGTAEAVLAHADELTPKLCERVLAFAPQLPITRRLVTLRRDVPMAFDLAACGRDRLRPDAVRPIFEELRFHRLMEALDTLGVGWRAASDPRSGFELSSGSEAGAAVKEPTVLRGVTRGYVLVDTPEKFAAFVAELCRQSEFAFDTETTGLNPIDSDVVGMSFSWKAGEAYYIAVRSMMGATLPVEAVAAQLKPVFEDASVAKVGQNAKYDMLVLRKLGIVVAGVRFDTMIASFLLDPMRRSHSLDFLAKSVFDHDMIPITDLIGKGKNQITMDQVDTATVAEYACEDADFTWRLKETLDPQITGTHVESLFRETEMPLVEVLTEMEHNGIAVDCALLRRLSAEMADRLMDLTRQVHREAGHSFNLDSTKQLATVLFDEQGFPVVRKTKTGRSTDAETLEALAAQTEHPILKLLLEYRELSKLKGTYVDTLPTMVSRRTGRIHASFNQTGAITGRLSSNDPNLQNIPIRTDTGRKIREAFVAGDSDSVLLAADYSQIELRLLAHFSQDAALLDAFRKGLDIHRAAAAKVNGISPEAVTPAQRSAAKAVNFGIIYGQTAFGLSRSLGIAAGEARAFIDAYFERYPGIRVFIDRCVQEATEKGYAQTILGRRRPIPELQSRNRGQASFGERIAVNTVVQGSAADLIKRAMVDIHRELKSGGHSAKMLLQVHDELVFEIPLRDVERQTEMIRRLMETPMSLNVPIVVDISYGRTWADCK